MFFLDLERGEVATRKMRKKGALDCFFSRVQGALFCPVIAVTSEFPFPHKVNGWKPGTGFCLPVKA